MGSATSRHHASDWSRPTCGYNHHIADAPVKSHSVKAPSLQSWFAPCLLRALRVETCDRLRRGNKNLTPLMQPGNVSQRLDYPAIPMRHSRRWLFDITPRSPSKRVGQISPNEMEQNGTKHPGGAKSTVDYQPLTTTKTERPFHFAFPKSRVATPGATVARQPCTISQSLQRVAVCCTVFRAKLFRRTTPGGFLVDRVPSRGVPLALELGIWNLSQISIRSGELADTIRTNPDNPPPPSGDVLDFQPLPSGHFHLSGEHLPELSCNFGPIPRVLIS